MKRGKKIQNENLQVDQSGKIEQTNIDTVLALTNGKNFAIVLKKKDKRFLEKVFKNMDKGKDFPYTVFSVLLAILLELGHVKKLVIVDREYMGHETAIVKQTLGFMNNLGVNRQIVIEFGHVGKLSKAHDYAAKIGSKKLKPDKIIRIEKILKLILEIKT